MTEYSAEHLDETLDPENWADVKSLGYRMIDDMIDHMATARARPAWQSMPSSSKKALAESTPMDGMKLQDVYEVFRQHVLPYPTGNAHPGFFGWVMGNGTATGMLADMLASGMNPHLAGYDQSATVIEKQVLSWLSEIMGFPEEASGLLVTGGTMANFNGLVVARNEKAGFDLREQGLQAPDAPRFTVYGSQETHSWILKSCELMGMGRQAFRAVKVNENFGIDLEACHQEIERDIQNGYKPFCIVGTAGTVNTGAIDDLAGLKSLADEFDCWFHIDGAFGSMAAFSPTAKHLVAEQSRADSIAFDLHKWGYMPYEIGCVLVRHPEAQKAAFSVRPSYLREETRGIAVENTYFADRGFQLSRGFRALKAWMSLKEQGVLKIGRIIQQNIDQARYLAELIAARPDLECLAPVPLNVVCYRFFRPGLSETELDAVNEEILLRIQESGRAVPSGTQIGERFAIRLAITNHRSTRETFEQLVEDTVSHGKDILEQY